MSRHAIGIKFIFVILACMVLSGIQKSYASSLSNLSFENKFIHPFGRQIIALYDSSEKSSENNNEIKRYLEGVLHEMGFEVVYHDINTGLPSNGMMNQARGIVTWYRDPQMKNAVRYCGWLVEQLKSGKKLVIIDNFGAYQDSAKGAWTDLKVVNEVFPQLGVEYKAGWTSDSTKLQVTYKDAAVVEKVAPIDLARIGHYYLFEKTDDSVKDYLTVSRTDMSQSGSSVIFSHPNGGMAFTRYFMAVDPRGALKVPNIDFLFFLRECFGRGFSSGTQKVLVVWDREDDEANDYLQNISWTLHYAKIDYGIVAFKDLGGMTLFDLKEYGSLIFYTPHLAALKDAVSTQMIKVYVESGGGLLMAHNAANETLNEVFGILNEGRGGVRAGKRAPDH